ncbi:peptidylprolyl isomerase [Fibrobacterota bacterium]
MTMVWIVKNAKYFIFTFGVLLVLGLVLMGPVRNSDPRFATQVGSVNGIPITLEGFRQDLNNYQDQERANTGRAPDGLQLVKLRKQLFDMNVNAIILAQLIKDYELYASGEEMWDYLERNPDPLIKKDSLFLTDGEFDHRKYVEWLHQDQTLDIPYIRFLETRMKSGIIPEIQLKNLGQSQFHQTYLEMAYEQVRRQNKARIYFYHVPLDSFKITEESITEQEIKDYFNANPDSFYTELESARLGYIQLAIAPSSNDTALSLEIIQDLKMRAEADSNFEDLAVSYSDDEGSAENGGSLGGYQTKDSWVPEFAEAAFSLEPGEISSPVLTKFGYHLIKCNGVVEEDTAKKVDASHILIRIDATPETVDSLVALLEDLKNSLGKKTSLQELAGSRGLEYKTTKVFEKWDFSPLGEYNYIPGFHSFAFSPGSRNETVSEVLQSEQGVYLLEKKEFFPPGRSLDRSADRIREILVASKKRNLATRELEQWVSQIKSGQLAPQLGKAVLDSTELISSQTWVPGFGYDSPALMEIFKQETGKWGEILTTDFTAVIAQVIQKEEAHLSDVLQRSRTANINRDPYEIEKLYSDWFVDMVKSAKVENNLDLIYRN